MSVDSSGGECQKCGKPTSTKCHLCNIIYYCSSECLSEDWESHSSVCLGGIEGLEENDIPSEISDNDNDSSATDENDSYSLDVGEEFSNLDRNRRVRNCVSDGHGVFEIDVIFEDIKFQPITRFKVKLRVNCKISEMRTNLSELTGILPTHLVLVEYFNGRVYGVYDDSDNVEDIKPVDFILAYEIKSERDRGSFNVQNCLRQITSPSVSRTILTDISLGCFCFEKFRSVNYYTYFGQRKAMEGNLNDIFDTHFFVPIYHHGEDNVGVRNITSSKDIYDLFLFRLLQFLPQDAISKLTKIFDLSSPEKIFPMSVEDEKGKNHVRPYEIVTSGILPLFESENPYLFKVYLLCDFFSYRTFGSGFAEKKCLDHRTFLEDMIENNQDEGSRYDERKCSLLTYDENENLLVNMIRKKKGVSKPSSHYNYSGRSTTSSTINEPGSLHFGNNNNNNNDSDDSLDSLQDVRLNSSSLFTSYLTSKIATRKYPVLVAMMDLKLIKDRLELTKEERKIHDDSRVKSQDLFVKKSKRDGFDDENERVEFLKEQFGNVNSVCTNYSKIVKFFDRKSGKEKILKFWFLYWIIW